jgi:hypothetical protein
MREALSHIHRFTKCAEADSPPLWNRLFLSDQRFAPDPAQSAAVSRGAYLGTALGHRADCHGPQQSNLVPQTKGLTPKQKLTSSRRHHLAHDHLPSGSNGAKS